VRKRLKLGWSVDDAFGKPVVNRMLKITFNGVTYPSESALAAAHGVSLVTVHSRRARGLTTAQCLGLDTLPVPIKNIQYEGVSYSTKKALAEAYGMPSKIFTNRLDAGWPLERALKTPWVKRASRGKPATPPAPAALSLTEINPRQEPFALDAANSGEVAEAA
jgi:hypothetical protein